MEIIVVEQIRDVPIKDVRCYRLDAGHTIQDWTNVFEKQYGYQPAKGWKWGTYVYFKIKFVKPK